MVLGPPQLVRGQALALDAPELLDWSGAKRGAFYQRRQEDLKLKALRVQIKAGVDALDQGDFVDVDDAELDEFLEGLTTPSDNHDR